MSGPNKITIEQIGQALWTCDNCLAPLTEKQRRAWPGSDFLVLGPMEVCKACEVELTHDALKAQREAKNAAIIAEAQDKDDARYAAADDRVTMMMEESW